MNVPHFTISHLIYRSILDTYEYVHSDRCGEQNKGHRIDTPHNRAHKRAHKHARACTRSDLPLHTVHRHRTPSRGAEA